MKVGLALTVVALLIGGTSIANTAAKSPTISKKSERQLRTEIVRGIHFYRKVTWEREWQLEKPYTRASRVTTRAGHRYLRYVADHWRKLAKERRREFQTWFSATYAKWECIHKHEGAWNDQDSGHNHHYGGLQMDEGFQKTYGSDFIRLWGWVYNWPVWAQLRAAERAYWGYHGYGPRYFGPWSTAGYC